MSFPAKKERGDVASVIGSGVTIEGDVSFSGVLRVDGTVRGKLSAATVQDTTLIVGEGGRIEGEVAATDVVVHGALDGVKVRCTNLELASSARVTGDLCYGSMDVRSGAIVEAQLLNRATDDRAGPATPEPALSGAGGSALR
jgi:cytoskeletal protein CcmA (bactofilin family)